MFDVDSLPPPAVLVADPSEVVDQAIEVPVRWWRENLPKDQLPGVLHGHGERRFISRQDVWNLASDVEVEGGALRLLWASMAWGAGPHLRLCKKRIAAAASAKELGDTLRTAAAAAKSDPGRAYLLLHSPGGAAMKYLGPAFGTKFLYFAGGGSPEHRSLILDSMVATALAQQWRGLGVGGGWPVHTYERYCGLLKRWTTELGLKRADQLELTLFRAGKHGTSVWG